MINPEQLKKAEFGLNSLTGMVTRFEVIDKHGRSMVNNDVSVTLSLQDDGKTLKVFVKKRED